MITSRTNPTVQQVRSVQRKRPPHAFFLEGPHLLDEAMRAGIEIEVLLLSPRARGGAVERAREVALRVVDVSDEILEYAADSRHPQGIAAVARVPRIDVDPERVRGGRLLVLDEVRDPGNLGTVARTAWASGMAALVLLGACVDAWNPKVVRASAGALFHLPLLGFAKRSEAGQWLAEHRQRALMATADGEESCFDADLRAPCSIVLGSEAHGIHPDTAAFCSGSLSIPMAGGCESLNLAASAAILCYLALDRNR